MAHYWDCCYNCLEDCSTFNNQRSILEEQLCHRPFKITKSNSQNKVNFLKLHFEYLSASATAALMHWCNLLVSFGRLLVLLRIERLLLCYFSVWFLIDERYMGFSLEMFCSFGINIMSLLGEKHSPFDLIYFTMNIILIFNLKVSE